jgi:transcription antitermination factor NusG
MVEKRFYCLKCRRGSEKQVIKAIERKISRLGMENLVGRIIKDKFATGYIYVEFLNCSKVVDMFRDIMKCYGFMNFDKEETDLIELSDDDVKVILSY